MSTTSVFFVSWEMQYDENSHSYGHLIIGSIITTTRPLMHHLSCRVCWWNNRSPSWLSPLQPGFGTLWLLAFPKKKVTFKREEISDCQWNSGKYDGAADGDSTKRFCRLLLTVEEMLRELCEVPECLLWRGLQHHCPMYDVSCILYLQ